MSITHLGTSSVEAADAGRIDDPNVPLKLLLARERILHRFRPVLHDHGLTEQQWRILRTLLQTGPIEQRQLEEPCGFSSASLAGILARMEAAHGSVDEAEELVLGVDRGEVDVPQVADWINRQVS